MKELLFKGWTSLSEAFGLINRISKYIDLVVSRDGLGFERERGPTIASRLSNRKRAALFNELGAACSGCIHGALPAALPNPVDELSTGCQIASDECDIDGQTLFIECPTRFRSCGVTYAAPCVKIEAGARSALNPRQDCWSTPLIAIELLDRSFVSEGLLVSSPERVLEEALDPLWCTYWTPGC